MGEANRRSAAANTGAAFDPEAVAQPLCDRLDAENTRTAGHRSSAPPSPPAAAPPPTEPLVRRLAAALGTPRPWQRITDPVHAAPYFRARALRLLAQARDPAALVAREEAEARRWIPSTTSNKGAHHG
jgi:hypothetical protein